MRLPLFPTGRLIRVSCALMMACSATALAQNSRWALRHQRTGGFLWSIATNGQRLVTVGTGGRILVSDDGVVWNERSSGVTDWLVGVAFGHGRFIAVGDNGRILISTDGDTWAAVANVPTAARLNNVLYGSSGFVHILGGYGSGGIAQKTSNRWVAVGEAGTALFSDDDGATWRAGRTGVSGWLRGLANLSTRSYSYYPNTGKTSPLDENGELAFVATGQGGKIVTSVDGLAWVEMTSGTTEDLEALSPVAAGSPLPDLSPLTAAVAIGSGGVVRSYGAPVAFFSAPFLGVYTGPPITYPAYSAWKPDSLGATGGVRLRGLAGDPKPISFSHPMLLASGEQGVVVIQGQQEDTGVTQNLVASVYHDSKFFVVGEDETILQQRNPLYASWLGNLSSRGIAGGARGATTLGFTIRGTSAKRVLVRAVGPSLGRIVPGLAFMPFPTLTLFDSTGRTVVANAGWANDPTVAALGTALGSFALVANSTDAAVVTTLNPGNYTVLIQPAAGTSAGIAVFEVYDADTPSNTGPHFVNVSTRGFAGTGDDALIGGFVVNGASGNDVLIRGIGPTLRNFGVGDALDDCTISIYNGSKLIATNDDWDANPNPELLSAAFTEVGAFALDPGSKDSALLLPDLSPGNYSVVLSAKNGATGSGLIEVYVLP